MFREFVVAKRRNERERERDVTAAWDTAHFTAAASVGKLRPLREVLQQMKPPPLADQNAKIQRAMLYKIAAQCGKTVTRTRLIRTDG